SVPVDGGELHRSGGHPVGGAHQDPGSGGVLDHRPVDVGGPGGGDHQVVAGHLAPAVGAVVHGEGGVGIDVGHGGRGHNGDPPPRRHQTVGPAGSHRSPSHHEAVPADQVEEDGVAAVPV